MGLLHTLRCPPPKLDIVVFKAEFSGLTEIRLIGSSILASHLKTDLLWVWDIWTYQEGTLKRNSFSSSPALRYKTVAASKRLCLWWLCWDIESCYKIRKLMKLVMLDSFLFHPIIACVSPNFMYWNLISNVLVFGGGALGMPLGPEDRALMNGISDPESFLFSSTTALPGSLSNHPCNPDH